MFELRQKVYKISTVRKSDPYPCPMCLKTLKVLICTPGGDSWFTDCPVCKEGWESIGVVSNSLVVPVVSEVEVISVIENIDKSNNYSIMDESGYSRTVDESSLFSTEELAENEVERLYPVETAKLKRAREAEVEQGRRSAVSVLRNKSMVQVLEEEVQELRDKLRVATVEKFKENDGEEA